VVESGGSEACASKLLSKGGNMTGMQATPESQDVRRPLARVPKPGAIAVRPTVGGTETVFVIEDDISVREALCGLLKSVGLQVQAFATSVDLLGNGRFGDASCMVVDIRLPGMSGLDFQATLAEAKVNTPLVFMSGHGDVPMTVRAMKAGAVDFLTKPFRDQDMLDAVATAIERNRARLSAEKATAELHMHLGTLSRRERETMLLVTTGLMNKQVAGHLGLCEATVKMYRGKAMKKMGARSLAELARMAEILGLHAGDGRAQSAVSAGADHDSL
jgi:FixJ family two-component response regulator